MFNGLGLGNYVNQDKSKLVNKMINGDNLSQNNNIPKSASSHSLSLQEKQRILAEQESAQNRAASKSPTPSKPVNLTDSLMSKSMSMSQMSPSPWSNTSNSINPPTTTWNNGTSGSSGLSGMSPKFPTSNLSNPTPAFGNLSQPASYSNMNSQAASKPDLSAFDSLMAGPAIPRQPMNAMQGTER